MREVCQRYGVVRLEVFGSVAGGSAAAESDIDLLYTLASGVRLGWAIEDMAAELAKVLDRRVDLVARRALHARLRDPLPAEAGPFRRQASDEAIP